MGWRPPGLSVPLPPLSSPAPQNPKTSMMAKINIVGYHPMGASTCLRKQEEGKTSPNAAQPDAKADGCVHDDLRADKLRKGWDFQVGTWNIDSFFWYWPTQVVPGQRPLNVVCVSVPCWCSNDKK